MAAGTCGRSFEMSPSGRALQNGDRNFCWFSQIYVDIIPIRTYREHVLSDEGALSRSDPSADRARAGRTGAPRNGRQAGGQGGAPGGAAPYVTGRARCLAARGGYVNPASKGARWCPGASRRSTPSRGWRGIGKPRTQCAARMPELGCLKIELEIGTKRVLNLAPLFAGRGRRASSDARRVRGQALRCQIKMPSGRKVCDATSTTRESIARIYRSASPLTRSLRCATASTSPRERAGRGKITTPAHWRTQSSSPASCSHPGSASG
jgi:hypothetical protein